MPDIVFNSDYDVVFMLTMIFVHDFLHDFNVVNFSERLKSIKGRIEQFEEAINDPNKMKENKSSC
jgi:hypothetical protein